MSKFQEKVYLIVKKIPAGKTMSYQEVAQKIDQPQAFRAVGQALKKNINPRVPCHRVIHSNGKIGGYNRGQDRKVYLLKKEGAVFLNKKKNN
ncbi:MGMT family protein [Patescibacteria group bacterium]|nr:MGMT family protein [Patescibacteria group bacterium]